MVNIDILTILTTPSQSGQESHIVSGQHRRNIDTNILETL